MSRTLKGSDGFRRRRMVLQAGAAMALAGVLPLAAAATFPFIPSHYTFTLPELQGAVQQKFPYRRRISQILNLQLDDPQVGVRPDVNRLSIGAHAHIESPFLQAPADGHFVLTSEVAYDRERKAMVLRSPAVDQLNFPDISGPYQGEIKAALDMAVAQLLEGYAIYTFKPDQLSFAGVHYEPGDITVLPNGVRVGIVER
jgi:hypothetical protein